MSRHSYDSASISTPRARRFRRMLASFAALLMVFTGVSLVSAQAAQAAPTASLTLQKTASTPVVQPGSAFSWVLNYTCGSLVEDCVNAKIVDTIPDEFEIIDPATAVNPVVTSAATTDISGQTVTVTFTDSLTGGAQGMYAATAGSVQIQVRLKGSTPVSSNGLSISNTAHFTADNADPKQSTATVTLDVPISVSTEGSKSFSPTSAAYGPGTQTTLTLNAKNTSNVPATSLTISDPADRAAGAAAFNSLDFVGFGTCPLPAGATAVQVDAYNAAGTLVPGTPGATPALPAGVAAGDVTGLVFRFTGSIAPGASVACTVTMAQRDATRDGAPLVTGATITNVAKVDVVTASGPASVNTAPATYTVTPLGVSVTGSKTFTPNRVNTGGTSTVAIRGNNTSGTTLSTMTVTENTGFLDGNNFTFAGFTANDWPAGATSAQIVYTTAAGPQAAQSFASGAAVPAPAGGNAGVRGFTITYTGAIVHNGFARVQFATTVGTNAAPAGGSAPYTNTAQIGGTNIAGTAAPANPSAVITVDAPNVVINTGKTFTPSSIAYFPGRRTIANLTASNAGSTVGTNVITMEDPAPGTSAAFYNSFNARAVSGAIPADTTLTVYVNTPSGWQLVDTQAGPNANYVGSLTTLAAPTTLDQITGVRMVYTKTSGTFAVPTTLAAKITYALRATLRDGSGSLPVGPNVLANCVGGSGSAGSVSGSDATPACANVNVNVNPGPGIRASKWWDDPATVPTRSSAAAGAQLGWRVLERGATSAVISDPASTSSVATTAYDAFNLTRIAPITAALDSLMRYDQVTKVELYDGTSWVNITSSVCTTATACQGTFPGYTLTAAQRASTEGVRLTFEPLDSARSLTDPNSPEVGSGVSAGYPVSCTGNIAEIGCFRHIDVDFELRDTRRSDGAPVVASTVYNTGTAGQVRNDVSNTINLPAGPITSTFEDAITLFDPTPATNASKSWSPATLTLPAAGSAYPTSTLTIAGGPSGTMKLDKLVLQDPTSGTNPFEYVKATDITTITVPTGADPSKTVVRLAYADGSTTDFTTAAALALSAADLANVVGITATFEGGRISGQASIVIATQVLENVRSTNAAFNPPVEGFPVPNTVTATATDNALTPAGTANSASATLTIRGATSEITAGKTFSPANTNAESPNPTNVALIARPVGTVAKSSVTITEDSKTFFNVFNVTAATLTTVPAGATQVQIDCKADTLAAAGGVITATPDTWVTGTAVAATAGMDLASALPAGCSLANLTGIRIVFTGTAITGAEAVVTLTSALRPELRTGGVVPRVGDATAAPGETVAGTVTNTIQVVATDVRGVNIAAPDATATFQVQPGTAAVLVSKTARNQVYPGTQVPFTLRFTNSGTGSLTSPTVVDTLPAGLDYDPTTMAATYVSSLGGAGLGNGTAVYDAAARTITYTWPAGAALKPGEVLTITQPLMIAPGTASGVTVVNKVGFTSDRTITSCAKDATTATAATFANNTCSNTAPVTALRYGGYVVTKDVKSEVDRGGIHAVTPGTECLSAGGYYRYPCASLGMTDKNDNWRLNLTNGGNLPGSQLTVIDVLPHPGDTAVSATSLVRGSSFRPVFAGNVALQEGNMADGLAMTVFYSTSDTPCTTDLYLAGGGCAAGAWTPYIEGTTDPSVVKALKFVFDFAEVTEQAVLPPTAQFSVTYDTHNTPISEVAEGAPVDQGLADDGVSWNSVAVGASFLDGTAISYRDPVDALKAGVFLPSGSVEVKKVVDGAGAAFAPTSFDAVVTCTVGGDPIVLENGGAITLNAANNYTVRLNDLPVTDDASCSVVEAGTLGSYGETVRTVSAPVSPAIVADDVAVPATALLSITNTYEVSPLTVLKSVTTEATVGSFGPFHVTVVCTLGSTPVTFTDGRLAFDIVAGTPVVINGIPRGASCTVTEDVTGLADGTTYIVDGATPADSATVVLDADGNEVEINNQYGAGQLAVLKSLDGEGAEQYGTGPFEVHVACTYGDPAQVLYDDSFEIVGGETVTLEDVFPAGTDCVVTEPKTGGANSTVIDTASVKIVDAVTTTVGITNVFDIGTLRINKVRDGAGAEFYGQGPFEVQATCLYDVDGVSTTVPLPNSGVLVLSEENDYSSDFDGFGIPSGADCTIVETKAAGANATVIEPNDGTDLLTGVVTIEKDTEATVTVTNTFTVGSIEIIKERVGDGVEDFGAGPFEVTLTCLYDVNGEQAEAEIPGGNVVELSEENGYTITVENLPVGADCTIVETGTGGAQETSYSPASEDGESAVVTVDADETAVVTITNTFERGELSLDKVVDKAVAKIGDTLNYTIKVSNTGKKLTAENVVVTDTLPAGLSFVSADNGGTFAGRIITWTIPSLAPGASVSLHVVATVDAVGIHTNRVTLTNPEGPWVPPVVDNQCDDDATYSCATTSVLKVDPVNGGGPLAMTGSDYVGGLTASAMVLLLGGGLMMLYMQRRRREQGAHAAE